MERRMYIRKDVNGHRKDAQSTRKDAENTQYLYDMYNAFMHFGEKDHVFIASESYVYGEKDL